MSKAKQVFLILIVVIVLTIVALLAITSRSGPVLQMQPPQYSEDQASERLETLKAAQNKHVVEVVPMKFFTEEIHQDNGEFALTAVTTMRLDDIAAVSFRATNSAEPSIEKWYDAEDLGGGRYRLAGTASDLGGCSGTYTIEAYITPAGGGETEAGSTKIDMTLTNYFYSEALGDGKQSLVLAGPKADTEEELSGVVFKVWSVDDDQDDIRTYTAKENEGDVWTAEIDVHDFSGKGDFIANAYAVIDDPEAEEEKEAASDDKETAADEKETAAEDKETSEKDKEAATEEKETAAEEKEATAEEKEKEPAAEEKETTAEEKETAEKEAAEKEPAEKEAAEKEKAEETEKEKAGEKETEEEAEEESLGTEIGIASERFELLPDPMDLPNGAAEVVTEGKRVYVKVPEIIQTPELPTGCESVALTIVLQSYGFELEKTEIAKNYLAFGTDMATSYVGDPFSKNGAGCFPPAIVDAANKYLKAKEDKRIGRNVTGTSIDDLCEFVDNGLPVILWSSMYMADPTKTNSVYTYQGKTYQWYRSEHCVVLYGYDKSKDVYLVSDPLVGLVERDASAFRNIYDSIGKYAVVIY